MPQRLDFDISTYLGGLADPMLATDAATKNYVDTKVGTGVAIFTGTANPNTTNPMNSEVGDLYEQYDLAIPTKIIAQWYKTVSTLTPVVNTWVALTSTAGITAITSTTGTVDFLTTAGVTNLGVNIASELTRIDTELLARVGSDIPRRTATAPFIPAVVDLISSQSAGFPGYSLQYQTAPTVQNPVSEIVFAYAGINSTANITGLQAILAANNNVIGYSADGINYSWQMTVTSITAASPSFLRITGTFTPASSTFLLPFATGSGGVANNFAIDSTLNRPASGPAAADAFFDTLAIGTYPQRFAFTPAAKDGIADQFLAGTGVTLTRDTNSRVTISSTGVTTFSGTDDPNTTNPVGSKVGDLYEQFNAAIPTSITAQWYKTVSTPTTNTWIVLAGSGANTTWDGNGIGPATIPNDVQLGLGLRGTATTVSGRNILELENTPFIARYDQVYPCITSIGGTKFTGTLNRADTALQGVTGITLTQTNNLTAVSAVVTFMGTNPFPVGFTSVVASETQGVFNIIEAGITVVGSVATLTGILSTEFSGVVDAGTYALFVDSVTSSDVASLNSLQGVINLTSTNNSVIISPAGQTINLQAATTGGAGVATGYNIGPYVQGNISTWSGFVDTTAETQNNEAGVQIGAGTGYSTNSNVIATPGTSGQAPTRGWTFNGTDANNVTAEFSAQKQLTRIGISGNWNTALSADNILFDPLFLKYGEDYNTAGAIFPGFTNNTTPYATMTPVATSVKNVRWCNNLGFTPTATAGVLGQVATINSVSAILITIPAGHGIPVDAPNVAVRPQITMPITIDGYNNVTNNYVGAEWTIASVPTSTTFVVNLPGNPALNANVRLNTANGATVPTVIFIWNAGVPPGPTLANPNGTSFGPQGSTIGGYVEVFETANTWFIDSATYNPQGFFTPVEGDGSYNFTKQLFTPGVVNVLSTDYRHYATAVDSWYSPNALVNWDNRITVNFGVAGAAIPGNLWVTWVNAWQSTPTIVGTQGSASNQVSGIANGTAYSYTYGGITRYRFVPTVYNPTQDAFYSGYLTTNNVTVVTGFLTARSS